MGRSMEFSKEQVRDAIKEAGGNIAKAADLVGASRVTVYNYINKYKALQNLATKERQKRRNLRVEIAENNLDDALEKGDWRATRLVLRTLGKSRGYTEGATGEENDPMHTVTESMESWKTRQHAQAEKLGLNLTE